MVIGKILVLLGLCLAVVGALLWQFPKAVTWFGRLPGDISYRGDSVSVFIPITSLIVLNLVIFLILKIIGVFRG